MTDYAALSKIVHILGYGGLVCGLYTVMIGGFVGGAEGAAITRVAGSILGNLVYKSSLSINDIRDLFLLQTGQLKTSRLKNLLWTVSVSQQAMSRNSKMLIGSTAHGLAGPCTEMLFHECAVTTLTDVVSGTSFVETSFAAENKYPDRPGILEARFTAELAHEIVASSLKRNETDQLVRGIISEKLEAFDGQNAPIGNGFKELYDIVKLKPKPEYLALYEKAKAEMQDKIGSLVTDDQ